VKSWEKLCALIPQPRMHLVRYSGVLAPNAKMRSGVIPGLTRAQIKVKEEDKDSTVNLAKFKSEHTLLAPLAVKRTSEPRAYSGEQVIKLGRFSRSSIVPLSWLIYMYYRSA
jgi:hypothetical protein